MVQSTAENLGHGDIRVNLVAPGILKSSALSRIAPETMNEYFKHRSLRRIGRSAKAAEMVAWPALEKTCITGQTIVLDRGLSRAMRKVSVP
jgi:NAD(P)-dependent dehydrogenase (short-subunit alcohol dehydrogenase family)